MSKQPFKNHFGSTKNLGGSRGEGGQGRGVGGQGSAWERPLTSPYSIREFPLLCPWGLFLVPFLFEERVLGLKKLKNHPKRFIHEKHSVSSRFLLPMETQRKAGGVIHSVREGKRALRALPLREGGAEVSRAGSCPPQGGMAGSRASFGTEAQVCAHSSEGTVSGYLACLPSSGPGST